MSAQPTIDSLIQDFADACYQAAHNEAGEDDFAWRERAREALQSRLAAAERVLRGVKAMALQHHGDEDKAALLHALLVEIPAEIDAHLAPAPTKPEGGEAAR